jgi:hypothetical protein
MAEQEDPVKKAARIVSAPKEGIVDDTLGCLSFFAKYLVLSIIGALTIGWGIGSFLGVVGRNDDFLALFVFAFSIVGFIIFGCIKMVLRLWRWFKKDGVAKNQFNDPNVR